MRSARSTANIVAVLAVCAGAVFYAFPPWQYRFYPVCPVFRYAHVLCPGCGSTRALASLLHGNFAQAWHDNALFVAILPVLMVAAGSMYWSAAANDRVQWPQVPKSAIVIFLAITCIFAVMRNF